MLSGFELYPRWVPLNGTVFMQSRETQITMVKWTNAGGQQSELMSDLLFTVACRLFSDFSIDSDHQHSLNSEAKEFIPSFQATGEYKTEKNGKLELRYLDA